MDTDYARAVMTRESGTITVHPRGFGFVLLDGREGEPSRSAFVVPPELNPFLADDRVVATIVESADGRWTARELERVERTRTRLFGEIVQRRDQWWLRVDREVANTDWLLVVPDAMRSEVMVGRSAVARIEGDACVLERAFAADADVSLERVIARHGIATSFPEACEAEVRVARERSHGSLLSVRRDLRDVCTVTIDAPSTRDIDDAISVLPADSDGALRLLVSIADVSEYVVEDSALDASARERATSTYLAGRVLPMFPEALSADWLSLVEGEERACLTAELRIDAEGRVLAVDVYESVIRSWARLNYDEVAAYLDRGEVSASLRRVSQMLPWLRTVSARIAIARMRRGGVSMVREEGHITMDASSGEVTSIVPAAATSAHRLIERCMVIANEAVARWLADRGVPALYRVHDEPTAERVRELEEVATNFGLAAGFGGRLSPLALAAFDAQMSSLPGEPALRSVLLRSLGAARYDQQRLGHFGLAAPLYLHFTSPIRRYADLVVHRMVKSYLRGARAFGALEEQMERTAGHINRRARGAARAENDRRRTVEAKWMAGKIGAVFSARITRMRPFGVVAQIDESLVEGMIPLESLPEGPWRMDTREVSVVNDAGRSLAIGMAVRVKVVGADVLLGRVEFGWAEEDYGQERIS